MFFQKLAHSVKWLYIHILNFIKSVWRTLWVTNKIPGPFTIPIFGSSWLYTRFGPYSHERYHESNFDKFSKYGPVVREEVLWNYPLYHLFDASDIDKIMKYKSDAPLRPFNEADVYYRKYRSDIFANVGMVNENGPEWLKLRKKLSPPLTNRKTSNYYAEPMNEIADELITVMMQNVDPTTNTLKGISSLIYKTGLEMMCKVALERRMGFLNTNGHMSNDMIKIMSALKGYQTAANQAMYGLPLWKYLPVCLSGVFTRLVEHKDTLFYTIGRLVDESLNQNNMESIDENSILGQLLKNHSLPLQEVKVSCVDYITAGVDTVGNSLLYTLWLISQDQRVQTKLRHELQFLTADELLHNPTYLKACVKESFRMYPTASQIARLTEEPTNLKNGYKLPAQSLVLCHTHVAGRQEENFTSADQFLPERWIPDERNPDWNHKPEIVIPFGSGKRICPGKRLAEQEIYILTAKIFKNFRLSPLGPFEVEFNWLLSPAGPLEFKIDLV